MQCSLSFFAFFGVLVMRRFFQGLEFSVARIIFNIDRFLTMLGTADLLLHEQVEGV